MPLRTSIMSLLPPRAVHAFRKLRHITLFPFEPEIHLVPKFVNRTMIAVDVGADVGLYTAILAPRAAFTLAIEPNPYSARHLRSLNLARCQIVEAAASNENGESVLRVPLIEGIECRALGSIVRRNDTSAEP